MIARLLQRNNEQIPLIFRCLPFPKTAGFVHQLKGVTDMVESSGINSSQEKNNGEKREKSGVHYINDLDASDRWRVEYHQCQERENKLAALSKLDYNPVNYTDRVARFPFKEMPLPDCNFLLEEAQQRTDKHYRMPITARIATILLLLLVLVAMHEISWAGWIFLPVLLVAFNLYRIIQQRQREFGRAVTDAQSKINLRHEMHRTLQKEARLRHEEEEDERIRTVKNLVNGDIQATLLHLEAVLPKLKFPFAVVVDIDVYEQSPRVKIWLPPKTVIPRETAELLPSGKVEYQDKDALSINKQYLEVCAATAMQIVLTIFAHIPAFRQGCVLGWVKDELDDYCALAASFDRQELIDASQAFSGVTALQRLKVRLDCDTTLGMGPVEAVRPESWGEAPDKVLWSRRITI